MIVRASARPYVCARCLSRQRRQLSGSSKEAPSAPPPSGTAKLTNRRLISLHGQDTPKFLQGIITNNVHQESTSGFFAAFLTAQGRVLHDTFVYPTAGTKWQKEQSDEDNPAYLVEVDAEQAEILLKHLKRHKLRSKFKLRLLDDGELNVWSLWKENDRWTPHGQTQTSDDAGDSIVAMADCRAPGMGQRLILPATGTPASEDVQEASLPAYTIRRYLRGVAEGQKEMPREDCLPLNSNFDIMNGIDFKKGCYVGQELTIRTHHTGIVRRRILPVMIYKDGDRVPDILEYDLTTADTQIPEQVDIRKDEKRKRNSGKLITGIGNVGIGLCRLEQMTDLSVTGEPSTFQPEDKFLVEGKDGKQLCVKAFVPDWIRGRVREPKVQKRVG